jgi:ribonucleoside-diphosphate reductase alpha chain
MTIEGAPHLHPEHYPIFDCANRCGKTGKRFLAPMSHVRMMAAVQPFLSGAISKTVNLPSESTVEEVQAIYEEGWRLGLKAVALYRDGCKASQPLSTGGEKKDEKKALTEMLSPMPATSAAQAPQLSLAIAPTGTRIYGERARLPHRRRGFTQEARIGSHKIYIRTGEYEDGQLGEIFIDMHKEGAAFRSVMNCLAMSVSLGLQYGVPLAKYVDQFTFTRFEPSGPVIGHPHVKFATSLVDYIFRTLGIEYLKRHDLAHVKPEIEAEGPTGMGVPRDQDPSKMRLQLPAAGPAKDAARPESAMDAQLDGMMGDAPLCDGCGHITVRNGSCYKCMNCGNSMGCS